MNLPTSVAPFILRGIAMYGIDSVMAPIEKRKVAWQRLATDLESGAWERRYAHLLDLDALDCGYRLVETR